MLHLGDSLVSLLPNPLSYCYWLVFLYPAPPERSLILAIQEGSKRLQDVPGDGEQIEVKMPNWAYTKEQYNIASGFLIGPLQ